MAEVKRNNWGGVVECWGLEIRGGPVEVRCSWFEVMSFEAALAFIRERLAGFEPQTGLTLGSGLGFFADSHLQADCVIPYVDIPGFPVSTVEGHKGQLVFGRIEEKRVVCLQGRFHFYEGYSMAELTLPVRLLAALGVQDLVLTNAAGGIREGMQAGDFMLIRDHINFMGANPLRGPVLEGMGPRFPDMTEAWDRKLRALAMDKVVGSGLKVHEGVYIAVAGPSFETPAEIQAFARLGADVVGMSTVPECLVARACGLRVLGISCVTNLAAGLSGGLLSHTEVFETAMRVREPFADWLRAVIGDIDQPA